MSGLIAQPAASQASPAGLSSLCPVLDAACVTHFLRFVHPADFAACFLVSRLWYECAMDTSLPFWRVLDRETFSLLNRSVHQPRPFCGCAALKAYRRLGRAVLEEVDLVRLGSCGETDDDGLSDVCAASLRDLVGLLFSDGAQRLQTLRLPSAPELAFKALHSGRALPPHSAPLNFVYRSLADVHFTVHSPCRHNALPQLRTLWMPAGSVAVTGKCFARIFEVAPQLCELYAPALRSLTEAAVQHLAGRPALRVNLLDTEPLPPSVEILCGVCRAPLWRGLTSFAKAPPTQRHITEEWYTNEPPSEGCQTTRLHDEPAMINCANGCHAAHQLYLVDAGTGAVALHGWRYGIAVGDGTGHTVGGLPPVVGLPPLAQVVPCAGPPGADGAAATA